MLHSSSHQVLQGSDCLHSMHVVCCQTERARHCDSCHVTSVTLSNQSNCTMLWKTNTAGRSQTCQLQLLWLAARGQCTSKHTHTHPASTQDAVGCTHLHASCHKAGLRHTIRHSLQLAIANNYPQPLSGSLTGLPFPLAGCSHVHAHRCWRVCGLLLQLHAHLC